ncbi:unnamed protein product [Cuscuta campestris]|uniref:Uncharacterized protein n=1 Tax=Cuscuta campestris TaxID=132261 RepID=A0A484K5G7_9ASTE|nr:unnamed protein product [Cuscuta campestris]
MTAMTLMQSSSLVNHLFSESSPCSPILKYNPPRFSTSIDSLSTDRIKLKLGSHGNFRVSTKSALSSSSSSRGDYKRNTDQMVPPYNVLITGGSKGIGYALAKEFLKAGDNVLICSRSGKNYMK